MPHCEIRTATIADTALLAQLDRAIFPGSAYSEPGWVDELEAATVLLAFVNREPSGFIAVARVGDDLEVRKVGVVSGERRAGIARQLLHMAAQAIPGARRILIDVAADNEPGIAFYGKCGFLEIARRRKYYSTGVDAIVMAAQGEALHKIMSAPSAK